MRRWAWLVCALVLAGCATPGDGVAATPPPTPVDRPAASCPELASQVVDTLQAYVDGFAEVEAEDLPAATEAGQSDLDRSTAQLRLRAEELGCDPDELAALVRTELERLTGGTPVQNAIAATFIADPLGTTDPSDPAPVDVSVQTADELVAALTLAGSGSTIRLPAGEIDVPVPLVARRPVTLVGAGRDETTLRSPAGSAALVIASDGDVVVRDLTLQHVGREPASVLVVSAGGFVLERLAVSGGVATADGAGGFGLVLAPQPLPLRASGGQQVLRDVSVSANEGGGVLAAGVAAPALEDVTVSGDRGCGLCWVDAATGTARDSSVTGTQVGVRVDATASPVLTALTVSETQTGFGVTASAAPQIRTSVVRASAIGVQVTGTSRPVLADLVVQASAELGLRLAGQSRPTVLRTRVDGPTPVGVALADDTSARLSDVTVSGAAEVGVLWAGRAGGSATRLEVSGSRIGLQVGDDSAPRVSTATVRATGQAALLAAGSSAGSVTGLVCGSGTGDRVGLTEDTTLTVQQSPTCTVVDDRS